MENEVRQTNWWVRVQVFALTLLLIALAGYRFVWGQPTGTIDPGLLAILALVVVLILSESFDSFSVGKLFSISREIKKKEKEVDKLEARNDSLISQLITLSNHQSQSQTHTNVYGDYLAAGRVEKATPEEVAESNQREAAAEPRADTEPAATPVASARRMIDFRAVEDFAFGRYALLKAIDSNAMIREAKLVIDFRGVDKISNTNPVFDGYIRSPGREVFLEVRPYFANPTSRDRLYMMLAKIEHYRSRSNIDARLDLIIVRLPSRPAASYESRIIEEFQPAIANNLLTITEINVSEAEEEKLFKQT